MAGISITIYVRIYTVRCRNEVHIKVQECRRQAGPHAADEESVDADMAQCTVLVKRI